MTKLIHTELTCPYCNNVFSTHLRFHIHSEVISKSGDPQVVLCDTEETDGCDQYFSVVPTLSISMQMYKMVEYYE